jgi:hypothetical protein
MSLPLPSRRRRPAWLESAGGPTVDLPGISPA